jgi:hypothetical protein
MTYPGNSRRNFLKTLTTTALVAPSSLSVFANITDMKNGGSFSENTNSDLAQNVLPLYSDGPSSPLFEPLDFPGNLEISKIDASLVSGEMAEAWPVVRARNSFAAPIRVRHRARSCPQIAASAAAPETAVLDRADSCRQA